MSSHGGFRYPSLTDVNYEIRLLRLLPGSSTDQLEANLMPVSRKEVTEYEALSYTWGSESASSSLILDGGRLPIRPNLASALSRLRKPDAPRLIWVDAVCINQDDVAERNAQVQGMRSIYASAKRVLVWLGEEENNSNYAMDRHGVGFHGMMYTDEWAEIMEPRWAAFAELMQRSWFKRVWIIQEIAVAKDVLVLCGDKSISWETLIGNMLMFSRILIKLQPENAPVMLPENEHHLIQRLADLRDYVNDGNHPTLRDLLESFSSSLCTDPRDKAFALLGISANAPIKTDYNQSLAAVLTELAAKMVTESQNLDLLAFAWPETRAEGLPTWVPDWNNISLRPSVLQDTSMLRDSIRYTASGDSQSAVEFLENMTVLRTPAYRVSEIGFVVGLPKPGLKKHLRRRLDELVLRFFNPSGGGYGDMESAKEAIRRTWLVDSLKGSRISQADFERFEAWYDRDGPKPKEKPVTTSEGYTFEKIDHKKFLEVAPGFFAKAVKERHSKRDESATSNAGTSQSSNDDEKDDEDEEFFSAIYGNEKQRTQFLTQNGLIGLGPNTVRQGDFVFIARGAKVPWVLRLLQGEDYEFIGECYVHGIMDGEWVNVSEIDDFIAPAEFVNLR